MNWNAYLNSFRRITEVEDGDIQKAYHRENRRKVLFILIMVAITVVCFFYTIGVGNYKTSFVEAFETVFNHLTGNIVNADADFYIWNMYMPRALGAIIVGGGLAIGGVVMQNLLKNPLAEPYTMGVSAGAMFGATLSIALGISIFPFLSGFASTMANAFVFSLVPCFIIVLVSAFKKVSPMMMILTGIAVMYLFSSINQIIMVTSSSDTMQSVYLWTMGTLSRTTWENLPLMVGASLVLGVAIYALSSRLDVMYSGDRNAQSLGIKAMSFRILAMVLASLLTAVLVSCTGTIGFVGLVAPHVARIFVGSNNRFLIPAAATFGMAFLLVADTIAKMVGTGSLPVGVISSLIGGPIFIFLLIKMRRHAWM